MSSKTVFAYLLAISLLVVGCTSSDPIPTTADGDQHASADHIAGKICGACGDAKGSESCCSDSAEKCDSCGMNDGSLLCCVKVDEAAVGKDLCGDCGHVAGDEACCAEDSETCECGMAKGAPLCCKLKTTEE